MTCRAAIYARSSPDCLLSIEEQGERLTSIACTQGWKVEDMFTDRAAVRVGLDKRPGEVALIDAIRTGTVRDDGAARSPKPSRQNFARTGSGTRSVD